MRRFWIDPTGEAAELLTDLRSFAHHLKAYHLVWIVAALALAVALMGGV